MRTRSKDKKSSGSELYTAAEFQPVSLNNSPFRAVISAMKALPMNTLIPDFIRLKIQPPFKAVVSDDLC